MSALRLAPMVWGNLERTDLSKPFCAACGRNLKPSSKAFRVYVYATGSQIVHPEDWGDVPERERKQGPELVGPECRKKFPQEFLESDHA